MSYTYTCPDAPRLPTIPLPQVTPPFYIRASLAAPQPSSPSSPTTSSPTLLIDFADPVLLTALAQLTPDEASRPATSPATNLLRIVHPSLCEHSSASSSATSASQPLYITPRHQNSNIITVIDLLSALHTHLWSPVLPNLNNYDTMRRQEIILAAQERCQRQGVNNDSVRYIDLLEHATAFAGLVQDIAQAREYVGRAHLGVDEFQAVTWILQTREPRGLGPYPRCR